MRALFLIFLLTISLSASAQPRPNILLILSDDIGFSDIGCYGGEISTPNLDQLASAGLRFTQFYNTSRCCPTRAALLTGLYPHSTGVGHMVERDNGHDSYRGDLNRRCVTVAEVLRPTGYRTYMSGKWHVTRFVAPDDPIHNRPLQRGFDRFYGTINGAGSFYDPTSLCRDNTYITPENDPVYQPKRFFYTDAITDNTIAFLSDHQKQHSDKPFFMYVAYTAAHWPMHAHPQDIEKYKGKYDRGYAPIRAARLEKARKLGVIDPKWPMSPQTGDWDKVQHKEWEARRMEVYAAMIEHMDRGIGQIVSHLRRQNQLDNTLILYLQDNGGCAEAMGSRANRNQIKNANYKPFTKDDLQPNIWPPMQTRDGRPVRQGPGVMPGGPDTYIGYGRAWANVSNTPFREYKHWSHEGGISTPLIVHWPTGLPKDRANQLVHTPAHLIDIMPTFIELAKAQYPDQHAGERIQPLEGISLLPAFAGQLLARKSPIWFEHEGNRALRDGQWKIVFKHQPENKGKWELYDMQADRTEMNDLASSMPDKVEAMAKQWQVIADRVGVQPWPLKSPAP